MHLGRSPDNTLVHKTSMNKFEEMEIMPSIFYNHDGVKLEISSRRKAGKYTDMWKLSNVHLNKRWLKEDSTWEIRSFLEKNEN